MFADILELSKIRITFFVTLSTLFGYLCVTGSVDERGVWTALGIFFLACASAVINHFQEKEYDSKMKRTQRRPLPGGRISPRTAVWLAVSYFSAGSIVLLANTGVFVFLLALCALIIYNAIYTPLKRISHLAVLPGAVIGAIPPLAGWVSAGGSVSDPQIVLIAFFFFIWQLPHFWLLVMLYRKDYENAGYPTLFNRFSESQVKRLTFFYTTLTGICGLLFPLFSLLSANLFYLFAVSAAFFYLLFKSLDLLKQDTRTASLRYIFGGINLYVFLVVLIVSLDKITMVF